MVLLKGVVENMSLELMFVSLHQGWVLVASLSQTFLSACNNGQLNELVADLIVLFGKFILLLLSGLIEVVEVNHVLVSHHDVFLSQVFGLLDHLVS